MWIVIFFVFFQLNFQLEALSERLLTSYDTRVDDFLSEIDRSVAASRDVLSHLDSSVLRTISDGEWDIIQLKVHFNVCNVIKEKELIVGNVGFKTYQI